MSKGDVVAAVQAGNHELSAVKSCTKAGTGCSGCSNLLKRVVDQNPVRTLASKADKGCASTSPTAVRNFITWHGWAS